MKKVRKGQIYVFHATGYDRIWPNENTPKEGAIVRVCHPHGCPPPNTMGHCHVETMQGQFIGLVCNSSLYDDL